MHSFLSIITDIGDSACLAALTAAAGIYLLSRRSGRALAFLVTVLLLSAGLIGLFKILFLGCHSHFHFFGIHSPSGHTATSAAMFWAVAILMRSQLDRNRRFLPLLLLTLLIAGIAVSRVALGYHTVAEVLLGLMVGLVALGIARFLVLRRRGIAPFDAYALALWCVVAVFLAHGYHIAMEDIIRAIASHIHGHMSFC